MDALPSLPAVSVDGDKLIRVIANLIGDTVASTPEGEGVIVAIREDRKEGKPCLILTISCSECQSVTEHSFNDEPNSTTDFDATQCKSIVEAHGGQLDIGKKTDAGKDYTLSIPIET